MESEGTRCSKNPAWNKWLRLRASWDKTFLPRSSAPSLSSFLHEFKRLTWNHARTQKHVICVNSHPHLSLATRIKVFVWQQKSRISMNFKHVKDNWFTTHIPTLRACGLHGNDQRPNSLNWPPFLELALGPTHPGKNSRTGKKRRCEVPSPTSHHNCQHWVFQHLNDFKGIVDLQSQAAHALFSLLWGL